MLKTSTTAVVNQTTGLWADFRCGETRPAFAFPSKATNSCTSNSFTYKLPAKNGLQYYRTQFDTLLVCAFTAFHSTPTRCTNKQSGSIQGWCTWIHSPARYPEKDDDKKKQQDEKQYVHACSCLQMWTIFPLGSFFKRLILWDCMHQNSCGLKCGYSCSSSSQYAVLNK